MPVSEPIHGQQPVQTSRPPLAQNGQAAKRRPIPTRKEYNRPLPSGASGPQSPNGKILSKATLPRSRDLSGSAGRNRSASVTTKPPPSSTSAKTRHQIALDSDAKLVGQPSRRNSQTQDPQSLHQRLYSPINSYASPTPTRRLSRASSINRLCTEMGNTTLLASATNASKTTNGGSNTSSSLIRRASVTRPAVPQATGSKSGSARRGGLVGLANLGNTCFMNSVLQCLSNSHPLLEYCLDEDYLRELNRGSRMNGSLFTSYAELMKSLWDENSDNFVRPSEFKSQIQRFAPRFMGYAQQDAQEFLRYLLDGLHEDVNRVKQRPRPILPDEEKEDRMPDDEKANLFWQRYKKMENSIIVDLFMGQLKSTLQCTKCDYKSTTFDPFWDLSLPIPYTAGTYRSKPVSLSDCFRLFVSKENLDGDEKPFCSKCKARRPCTKSFSIQKFPTLLVIHLKRFFGDRYRSKMSTLVQFPLNNLDLSDFAAQSCPKRHVVYNLYAVSNHTGSVHGGHYTASCRHHHTDRWYEYNDNRVNSMDYTNVVGADGYVLFYELAEDRNGS